MPAPFADGSSHEDTEDALNLQKYDRCHNAMTL